jgi:hypothetical protein
LVGHGTVEIEWIKYKSHKYSRGFSPGGAADGYVYGTGIPILTGP